MTFAIVDQERDGIGAVLMLVDEKREAEEIAIELRRAGVRAEARASEGVWPRAGGRRRARKGTR